MFHISLVLSLFGGVRLNNIILCTLVILAFMNSTTQIKQEWGVYHYYIGSKYFHELGYFDLYECSIESSTTRRNLNNYSFRFDEPDCNRDNFTDERWQEFQHDLQAVEFEPRMMTDKGMNATISWITVSEWLTNAGIINLDNLYLVDLVTLLVALLFLIWSVGWTRTAYIALFILTFYGTMNRLWGHYAQWVWLSSLLIGLSLLHKKHKWGGFWIGVSAGLYVFPIFLMLFYWRQKKAILWCLVGLTLLGSVGMFNSRGLDGIGEFADNMTLHSRYIRTEFLWNIGLAHTISTTHNADSNYLMCFTHRICRADYENPFPAMKWLLLAPLVMTTPLGLIHALLTLSNYYYLIMAVVGVWYPEKWIKRLLILNGIILAWILTNRINAMIYNDMLWFGYFIWLGIEESNVIQNLSLAVAIIQQRLHPQITTGYVGNKI